MDAVMPQMVHLHICSCDKRSTYLMLRALMAGCHSRTLHVAPLECVHKVQTVFNLWDADGNGRVAHYKLDRALARCVWQGGL